MSAWKNLYYVQPFGQEAHLSAEVPVEVQAEVVPQEVQAEVDQAQVDSILALDSGALRTDGPTLEQYVEAGYAADTYPPQGYAVKA